MPRENKEKLKTEKSEDKEKYKNKKSEDIYDKINNLIELSRFTTCKIQRNFLPRRIGLGYDFRHENKESGIIQEIKRKSRKNKKLKVEGRKIEESSEEEMLSRSKMVK